MNTDVAVVNLPFFPGPSRKAEDTLQEREASSQTYVQTAEEVKQMPPQFVEEKVFISEIKRIDSNIENMKKAIDKQDDKFSRAIEKLEKNLDTKFEKIDQRFEKIDQQFEKIDQRFEKIEQRFTRFEDKLDSNFKWLVGIYVPLTGVLLAAFYAFATYIKK